MVVHSSFFCSPCLTSFFSKPSSPFENLHTLSDLASKLRESSFDQWMEWRGEIKTFIKDHPEADEQMHLFINELTSTGLEKDPQKMMDLMGSILSVKSLTSLIHSQFSTLPIKNALKLAKIYAHSKPAAIKPSILTLVWETIKDYLRNIVNLIPNLFEIFFEAFRSLDFRKRVTTIWDKYLLVSIIMNLCAIPINLINTLQPFLRKAAKIYLVAALILAVVGFLLYCYQRWWRPLPDVIVHCTNLDTQYKMGKVKPKIGQTDLIQKTIAALETRQFVVLKGKSGEGKSAMFNHLVTLNNQNQLPEKLSNLHFFELNCDQLMSSGYSGLNPELVNKTKDQIIGYEKRVVFLIDEFSKLLEKLTFPTFKQRFLNEKGPYVVICMTTTELQDLEKLDSDGSFMNRVKVIDVEKFSDDEVEVMLRQYIRAKAQDIHVSEEAIQTITQKTKDETFWYKIGRPGKAKKILKEALAACRVFFNPNYISPEVDQQNMKLRNIALQPLNKQLLQNHLKNDTGDLQNALNEAKKQIKLIKECREVQSKLENAFYHDCATLANVTDSEENQNTQARLLWYYLYGMDAMLKILVDKIQSPLVASYDVHVGAKLIEKLTKGKDEDRGPAR